MSSIEVGPASTVGAIEARLARIGNGRSVEAGAASPGISTTAKSSTAAAALSVQTSDALDAGAPPVDADRVAEIRKAVENGTYPVLPARIADAMIAAGVLLRNPR